ncbi:MAG: putative WhiB family transcriptional regulator [Ilumatobacteraceae bacterium]|nr:putative WhiB family transcriptional regulator [Ilumatobacteraceae bacterium]
MLRGLSQGGLRRRTAVFSQTNGKDWVDVSPKVIVWRELGACRGLDPSMFYPDEEDDAATAKAVCQQCDVRIACLEHALASREKQGVWGGATERERRRIIRQRRRTA